MLRLLSVEAVEAVVTAGLLAAGFGGRCQSQAAVAGLGRARRDVHGH